MKLKWRVLRIAVCSCVLLTSVYAIGNILAGRSATDSGEGLMLVKPAFAQSADASFLEQEAGIAAYVNVGQQLNLARSKSAFKTIEAETETYIIGSVLVAPPSDYWPKDVHVYVSKEGWIVAYYLKDDPTFNIIAAKYAASGASASNNLRDGLIKVSGALGVTLPDIKYYSFQYPGATKLMLITGKTFSLMIPADVQLFEASYAGVGHGEAGLYIDGAVIYPVSSMERISLARLTPNVFHTFYWWKGYAFTIVLLYREP